MTELWLRDNIYDNLNFKEFDVGESESVWRIAFVWFQDKRDKAWAWVAIIVGVDIKELL